METAKIRNLDDIIHLLDQLKSDVLEERTQAWTALRTALFTGSDAEEQSLQKAGKELIEKVEKESEGQLEPGESPLKHWIDTQPCLEAKIGALRILARVSGREQKVWKGAILAIALDETRDVDLRAWALYSLYWAQIELNEKNWADIGQPIVEKALNAPQAKVRQWAAMALGEMAAYDQPQRPKKGQHTHLSDAYAHEAVETALIQRWVCEIDIYVAKQLIISLGKAGGYVHRSLEDHQEWPVLKVLREAASYDKYEIRQQVPTTVKYVAETLLNLHAVPTSDKAGALKSLLSILESWFEHPGDDYDTYRSAITRIGEIMLLVLQDTTGQALPEIQEKVTGTAVEILLNVAESKKLKDQAGVRDRALRALRYAAGALSGIERQVVTEFTVPRLKMMLADPNATVSEEVSEGLITMLGEEKAADFFVDVILKDSPAADAVTHRVALWKADESTDIEALERLVRRRAALALGRISQSQAAHDRLVESLKQEEGITYQRASEALKTMGGQKAVQALIEATKRQWLESKFFGPIEDADQHGQKILDTTVWMSILSYIMTLVAAVIIIWFGSQLLYASIQRLQASETTELKTTIGALTGAATAIAGLLLPFFWNPAGAVQKANAEMTKLVTAFHGYMGRMRLLGLGFAHAYTQDRADTNFLIAVSNAAGNAMVDAAGVLTNIGLWPGSAKGTVQVPDFTGLTWIESEEMAKAHGLNLTVKDQAYSDHFEEGLVLKQSLVANTAVEVGTSIALTLSKGKQPEEVRLVKTPTFVGRSWEEAQKLAREQGLSLTMVQIVYSDTVAENQIAIQDLKAGTEVSAGTEVRVAISKGTAPKAEIVVPQLTGMTWDAAQTEATRNRLQLTAKHAYNEATEGTIINQTPPPNVIVYADAMIELTISKGQAPTTRGAPNFINMTWDKALIEALKNNLILVLEKLSYDDTVPEGAIISQSILPGMMVTDDTVILLTVSKGPKPPYTTIPNFVGESETVAQTLATEYYLKFTLKDTYSAEPEGHILDQSLPEGLDVKRGTEVVLTMSKGPEPPEGSEPPAEEITEAIPEAATEMATEGTETVEETEAEEVADKIEPSPEAAKEETTTESIADQLLAYEAESESAEFPADFAPSEEMEGADIPSGGGEIYTGEEEPAEGVEIQVSPPDEEYEYYRPKPKPEEVAKEQLPAAPPLPPIKPRRRIMKPRRWSGEEEEE